MLHRWKFLIRYYKKNFLSFISLYILVENLYRIYNLVINCEILFIESLLIIELANILAFPQEDIHLEFD